MNVQVSGLVRFKFLFVVLGSCVILAGCGNEGVITKTVTGKTYVAEVELGVVIVAPNAMSADEMDAWSKGLANLPKYDDIRRPVARALVAEGHWPKGRLDAAMFYLFDNVQTEVLDEGSGVKISAVGDTEKMAQCIADATAVEMIRMMERSRGEGVLRATPDLHKALQEHLKQARESRIAKSKAVKALRIDPEVVARLDEMNTHPEVSEELAVYRAERDALKDLKVDLALRTVIGQDVGTLEAAVKHQESVLKTRKDELAVAWGDSGKLEPMSEGEVVGYLDFETLRYLHDDHETQKAIVREIEKKLALMGDQPYPAQPMVVQRFSAKVVE